VTETVVGSVTVVAGGEEILYSFSGSDSVEIVKPGKKGK